MDAPKDWYKQVRALHEQLRAKDQAFAEAQQKSQILEVTLQTKLAQLQALQQEQQRVSAQTEIEHTDLKDIIKAQRLQIQDLHTKLHQSEKEQDATEVRLTPQNHEGQSIVMEESRQEQTPPRRSRLSHDEKAVTSLDEDDDLQVFQRISAVKASLEELQSCSDRTKARNAVLTEELANCRRNVHNHKYVPNRRILGQVSARLKDIRSYYLDENSSLSSQEVRAHHDSLATTMGSKVNLSTSPPQQSGSKSPASPLTEQVAALISTVKAEEQYTASLIHRMHENRKVETSSELEREPASPPRPTSFFPADRVVKLLAEKEQYMNEIVASLEKFNSHATIPVSLYKAEMAQLRESFVKLQQQQPNGDDILTK
jgi:DNA repair exonuclease SbcCD ATPase subunit